MFNIRSKRKSAIYDEFYLAYIGDSELDEIATDDLQKLRDFIEALELELGEFTAQAEVSVEPEPVLSF